MCLTTKIHELKNKLKKGNVSKVKYVSQHE